MPEPTTPARDAPRQSAVTFDYWLLSRRLAASARIGLPLRDYLELVAREICAFTGAEGTMIWIRSASDRSGRLVESRAGEGTQFTEGWRPQEAPAAVQRLLDRDPATAPWLVDEEAAAALFAFPGGKSDECRDGVEGVVILRLRQEQIEALDIAVMAEVVLDLGRAVADHEVRASLRERMKELNCLYRMALVAEQPGNSFTEVLQGIAAILPDAWLNPAAAWVRLELDDNVFTAGAASEGSGLSMQAVISAAGQRRGRLVVGYVEPMPELDDGPFLREEHALLQSVAREIARIVEREDISRERHELEEQLRHAERLATIGEMAAGLAHELNDPLNNILGYGQFIAHRQVVDDDTRSDAEVVVSSAMHARDVIRQLLTFARRMPQQRTTFSLGGLVVETEPLLRGICGTSGIELDIDARPGEAYVSADPGQLRQVVLNLASNGARAMPDGGRLAVSVSEKPPGVVRLEVVDTGEGMTEEVVRKAFLPFFTTRDDGTGLGLAVVHGIVEAHSGSVDMESSPGAGTRFEVRLPSADAEGEEEAG